MDRAAGHAMIPLLFDPQTAGGSLAALPADASLSDHMTHIGTIKSREECVTGIRIVI
jgi:hypothetical protein